MSANPKAERVANGMQLPDFGNGTGKANVWRASDMNRLVRVLNAILNIQVGPPTLGSAKFSDSNLVIQIDGAAGGGSGTLNLGWFQFQSMGTNYLVCYPWDPVGQAIVSATATNVALPPECDARVTAEIDPALSGSTAITYVYTLSSQKRVATLPDTSTETQYITPPYLAPASGKPGTILLAVSTTTNIATVTWQDLGISGRQWAWTPY